MVCFLQAKIRGSFSWHMVFIFIIILSVVSLWDAVLDMLVMLVTQLKMNKNTYTLLFWHSKKRQKIFISVWFKDPLFCQSFVILFVMMYYCYTVLHFCQFSCLTSVFLNISVLLHVQVCYESVGDLILKIRSSS